MKKSLAVVVIVLGVFFALRYMERSIPLPGLPPQPPAPTVPEGPQTPTAPTLTAPQEPPPTTTLPGELPSGPAIPDLDALLASVDKWKDVPDLRLLTARCVASPMDKLGPVPKEASGEFTALRALERMLEEIRCSGKLEGCARIETMERLPAPARPDGHGDSVAFMSKDWCRESVVHALYARSVAEGRPSESYCRGWLQHFAHFYSPAPRPEEISQMCEMLASDFSTGGHSYCTALQEKYGVDEHGVEHCMEMMIFAKGEQACVNALKDPAARDLCLGLARVYSAARSRDLSKCKGKVFPGIKPQFEGADRECLAVMGDPKICRAVDGPEEAKKRWYQRQCPAWAFVQLEGWIRDVDANAQFAIDQLPRQKERLASLTSAQQRFYAPKIDAAMKSTKDIQKIKEDVRNKMNKGQLPGQVRSGPAP